MTSPRTSLSRLAAACLVAATIAAPTSPAMADPPKITPQTRSSYQPMAMERLRVPTRGGEVYVRLVRPNVPAGVQVPVILTYTPYTAIAAINPSDVWVRRGYARAVADVVGTGNSGGCWDYGGDRERHSGHDLVEWLGTRPWANGKVGMIGASYDGTTANMVAVDAPPQLAAIVPEVAISDWYSYAYGDGIRYFLMDPGQRQGLVIDEQGFDTPLLFDFAEGGIPPADRGDVSPDMRYVERYCPGTTDKLEHTRRAYVPDPDYDEFWRTRGYIHDAAKVRVPVLVQGGWRDYNVKHSESSRWFAALPMDDPGTAELDGVPFKMLLMGQGAHAEADVTVNGVSYDKVVQAFFDTFLYGYDGSSPQRPDTYITKQHMGVSKTNDGVTRIDPTWPPASTETVRLHLRANGSLSQDAPGAAEGASVYRDSGATTESAALQARANGADDVLWFESAPLSGDLRVAGTPVMDLFASSDSLSTHFTPVLFDLGPPVSESSSICTYAPAQQACTVARGFLNALHRNGLERGELLTPGAEYRARVRLIDNDWVFKAGHRIGVAMMSSNAWWAVPDATRALNTIGHDAARPSALELPVVGGPAAAAAAGL